jgi:WXG100 family type VII secretion target
MSEPLKVKPEDLVTSGAQVDEHSQNVFVTHSAADQAIEASLARWAGSSQAAMADKAGAWATVTMELTTRLYTHGEALRVNALSFSEMDKQNAEDLAALDPGESSA